MDRNSIIGWVLIALLMIGFFFYQSRQIRKQQEWQAQQDSLARVEKARLDSIYYEGHKAEMDSLAALRAVSDSAGAVVPVPDQAAPAAAAIYKDASLASWGEDVRDWGGAFAVYRGLTEALPYHRLFNSPISESAIVGGAVGYAMAGGRVAKGRVIVEGFIDFDYEITQLTVRAKGKDGQVETHFCDPVGHIQQSGDYVESWQPHPMHPAALEKARQIAKAVTDDLGGLGLFGVELFVKGEQVWFSEVSPRPHDTGLVTLCTQWQSEFELHARAILGLPVDASLRNPGASAVIYGGQDAEGLVFDGVDEALAIEGTDLRLFGKPEAFVKRRMGVALARARDVETARANAKLAASKVQPRKP